MSTRESSNGKDANYTLAAPIDPRRNVELRNSVTARL